MSNIPQCQDLATKSELLALENQIEQLKEQINQLLGRPEGGGSPIDVLSQGDLSGTAIDSRLVDDIELTQDTSTGEIQAAFSFGIPSSGVGGSGVRLRPLLTGGFELLTAPLRFQVALSATMLHLITDAKQREELNEKIGTTLVDFIDSSETARAVEVKLRDVVNNGSSLLDVLDKAFDTTGAKNNVDNNKAQLESLKQENALIKDNIFDRALAANDLLDSDILGNDNSGRFQGELDALSSELAANNYADNQTRQFFGEAVAGLQGQLQLESDRAGTLEEKLITFRDRINQTEQDLIDAEIRYDNLIAEQQNYKDRIEELEQWIADPTNYNTVPANPPLPPTTSSDVIKSTARASRGGGVPASVRNSLPDIQNQLIDLGSHLAGDPSTVTNPSTGATIPVTSDITYSDIINNNSDFTEVMEGLIPEILPNTGSNTNTNTNTGSSTGSNTGSSTGSNTNTGATPQVTPQELDAWGQQFRQDLNNDFDLTLTGIVAGTITPPLTDIRAQTAPAAISSAASDAICNQATNPSSCLNTRVVNPLANGFNNALNQAMRNLNTILNGAILAQGQQIFSVVTNTNEVLKNSLLGSVADKTLNALNTALLVHNAVMLSNQVGETVGDIASIVLNGIGIRDSNGDAIDVNSVLKTKLASLIRGLIGRANYNALTTKLATTNRIYQASQNIINDTVDMFDATTQLLEDTGGNVAKIGNSLREAGEIEYNSFSEMNENVRARSRIFKQIEGIEGVTDKIYSVTSTAVDIKENYQSIKANRKEFDEAIEQFTNEAIKQQDAINREIESLDLEE